MVWVKCVWVTSKAGVSNTEDKKRNLPEMLTNKHLLLEKLSCQIHKVGLLFMCMCDYLGKNKMDSTQHFREEKLNFPSIC